MNPRLDAPYGSLIDRNQPRSFTFEGETVNGYLGDTVASALIANNHWLLFALVQIPPTPRSSVNGRPMMPIP